MKQIRHSLSRLSQSPVVTEHAILRYLERVKDIDIKSIEQEMLNEMTIPDLNKFGIGAAKIPIANQKGYRFVVKDKTIITIERS